MTVVCVGVFLHIQAHGSKVEKVYNETLPVNSASELRKRPPSLYASSKGNVMQKAKVCVEKERQNKDRQKLCLHFVLSYVFQEWESKKGT